MTYDEPESLGGLSSGGSGATAMGRGGTGLGAAGLGGRAATGGTSSGLAQGGSSGLVPAPTSSTTRPPPVPSMGGSGMVIDPGPPGEELLFENFDDQTPANFAVAQDDGVPLGIWAVVPADGGGFAYEQSDVSTSDESFAVGGDIAWTNVSLEAKVRFTAANDIEDATALLAVRFSNLDAYYFLAYRGDGTVKLRARANGSTPEFASSDDNQVTTIGQVATLKLVVKGTTLTGFLNNNQVVGPIENAELAAGGIALGASENSAVQFDDVKVTIP